MQHANPFNLWIFSFKDEEKHETFGRICWKRWRKWILWVYSEFLKFSANIWNLCLLKRKIGEDAVFFNSKIVEDLLDLKLKDFTFEILRVLNFLDVNLFNDFRANLFNDFRANLRSTHLSSLRTSTPKLFFKNTPTKVSTTSTSRHFNFANWKLVAASSVLNGLLFINNSLHFKAKLSAKNTAKVGLMDMIS